MGYSRIEAAGYSLNVLLEGSGDPVVMLHGFPDSSLLWRHQVPALVDAGRQVIAPDLRGFGESDKSEGVEPYLLTNIVQDVVAIMDSLDVERAHLVGHDWGAVVGWLLAAFFPERVERLVAISVGHPSAFAEPFLPQLQKSWYMLLFQFEGIAEEALRRNDWELFRVWLDGAPHAVECIEAMSKPGALTAGLNWYRANLPPDRWTMDPVPIPEVAADTLGIWGAGDPYLTEEQMVRSADFVKGKWRYERFEDAGHWIPLEQPEKLNALLLDFLQ